MSGIEIEEVGTASEHKSGAVHKRVARHHDSGLLAIGLFKLAEAVFFLLVGAGAIHFIHHDLGDAAVHLAERLRVDPDGRLVSYVIDHLDAITAQRLKQIGLATFFYAALRAIEGVGLVMEQVWAEYLTVGVTTAFLPWECTRSRGARTGCGCACCWQTSSCWRTWCGGWDAIDGEAQLLGSEQCGLAPAIFAFVLLSQLWLGRKGEFAGEPSGTTLHIAVVA